MASGIGTALLDGINFKLDTLVAAKVALVCSAIAPVVTVSVIIYWVIYGVGVMRGETQDAVTDLPKRAMFMGIILLIGLSSGQYMNYVIRASDGVDELLIGMLGSGSNIGDLIDNSAEPFFRSYSVLMQDAMIIPGIPDLAKMLTAVIIMIAEVFLTVVGLSMYLLALIGQKLLFIVGPIFIICFAFPLTKRYGENWVSALVSFSLVKSFIVLVLSLVLDLVTQFALEVESKIGSAALFGSAINLVVLVLTLIVVLFNMDRLAGSLTGGATMTGIGRELFRFATSTISRFTNKPSPQIGQGRGAGQQNSASRTTPASNSVTRR